MKVKFVYIITGYEDYSLSSSNKISKASSLVGDQDDKSPIQLQSGSRPVEFNTSENNSLDATIECDPSSTTCFVENDTVVRKEYSTSKIPDHIELRLESIKDFLAKPVLMTTVVWNISQATNTDIWLANIATMITTQPIWTNKIAGFELLRARFNLRITVNANPFQQGIFMVRYFPCYSSFAGADGGFTAGARSDLISKRQQPCVEVSARDSIATLAIPYITPYDYYDLKEGVYDWGTVFMTVIAPLRTGAAGNSEVQISVYAYLDEVDLAAPILPQSGKRKVSFSATTSKEANAMEDRPISTSLSLVSKAASSLSSIPLLSPVMGTISWVARTASGVASIFGWSKVDSEQAVTVMGHQLLRYFATSDGNDLAFPLALIQDNHVEITDTKSITNEDEMSMAFLKSIPHLHSVNTWTTSQTSGTAIYQCTISPSTIVKQQVVTRGAHTLIVFNGAPWVLLNGHFQYWRGSINMHIKFSKTLLHTGRFEVTFTPYSLSPATLPSINTSAYSLREVVDLRYQSEVKLNLPYMLPQRYISTNSAPLRCSGTVQISVINELRCPENASSTIDYIVYYTAGDDFEYSNPSNWQQQQPFQLQSGQDEIIVDSGIAESRRENLSLEAAKSCIGEQFTSLKQFLNRFSTWYNSGTTLPSGNTATTLAVFPFAFASVTNLSATGVLQAPRTGGDISNWVASLYAFYRGSARIMLKPAYATGKDGVVFMSLVNPTGTNDVVFSGYNAPAPGTVYPWSNPTVGAPGVMVGGGGITMAEPSSSYGYCRVPYYNKYPISLVIMPNNTNSFSTERSQPITAANFIVPDGSLTNYNLFRSFCDDFQFTFFVGCPAMLVAYS